ncbi:MULTISPECIES: DUF5812 family protein [Halomicrobium]|uniref:Uncharacterized protein n=2 Tax=Halomicrobium mukohataei TaxID=57705 RepID=C7P2W9_HALMD|nr:MULTISPECIES: DUF5812 family protein [Halomicrobium]ACV47441.1 conserved hypothetical protein [Halomicrobium mukohataei DSM 12286]QCD65905.1 hypothetical protein E5139_09760 [Halomicrobium mukohataei]QFR20710.1 hypothetical protein GBQ70_09755 [Halomicrobium sp. ZPS1]
MKSSTFLVTAADDETATLRDVVDQQVVTLSENPGLAADEVIEATVEPEPPLEVAYQIVELERQWEIPVERSPESPTTLARDIAAEQADGEITKRERAGEGEVHVLTVPDAEAAADDVLDDDATRERAARLGVDRVSVRAGDGVVSVRYLPN